MLSFHDKHFLKLHYIICLHPLYLLAFPSIFFYFFYIFFLFILFLSGIGKYKLWISCCADVNCTCKLISTSSRYVFVRMVGWIDEYVKKCDIFVVFSFFGKLWLCTCVFFCVPIGVFFFCVLY